MKRLHVSGLILAVQFLFSIAALAEGGYKAEAVGAPPASDLPKPLAEMLQPEGSRLVDEHGQTLGEVWLRKEIPTRAGAGGSAEILYGSLAVGTFVGAIHFPEQAADYRGQTIKPGFYALRYALIPQDGNHMGVNPSRDALLLTPAAADTQLDKALSFEEMVKLSRQASGTPHPGLLILAPASGGDNFPAASKDDLGHWNLQVKGRGSNGDFPIAITLVGKWEG